MDDCIWKNEIENRILDLEHLPSFLSLSDEERLFCKSIQSNGGLPFVLTPHFVKNMENLYNAGCRKEFNALRNEVIPSPLEEKFVECELQDPLGEHFYQITPHLVHQYKNRCLLLSTGLCFSYCRYCFRRSFTSRCTGLINEVELNEVCDYVKQHSEIEEILISGGDILTVNDEKIEFILSKIRKASPNILIRICTRANVFMPSRFTNSLINIFKKYKPLWLIPHINHYAELSEETIKSISDVIDAGIAIQSQTVLLKNVNDDIDVLTKLFNTLVKLEVKPGYLFQCDLAKGTAHLRVSVDKGLKLYNALKKNLSGLSLPVYAVDLPNGGGKFNLNQLNKSDLSIIESKSSYKFVDCNDELLRWEYPKE